MNIIYQSQFTRVGHLAREGFTDHFFITFSENKASADMHDYCFIHKHGELTQDFAVGDAIILGGKRFSITAIGDAAISNFRELGHATLYFDGKEEAQLAGAIHLLGVLPEDMLKEGCSLVIETY